MASNSESLREVEQARRALAPKLSEFMDLGKYAPLRHEIHNVGGHTSSVRAVAITPDGHLVTGSGDKTAKLWDLGTSRCLQTFNGHTSYVNAVAVTTPDGKRLVTGSDDNTAKLWDLGTGRCLRTFSGHTSGVNAVAVTPDGKRLVTGSLDHTVKFWDVESSELLATLHNVNEGFLWTTPPSENAPSGWLWTNREDLVSSVQCNKTDSSQPIPLADNDPVRRAYFSVFNNRDMVMSRLTLLTEGTEALESAWKNQLNGVRLAQSVEQSIPRLEQHRKD